MTTCKKINLLAIVLLSLPCCTIHKNLTSIEKISWIHGSPDCNQNPDPPIQIVHFNDNTWILRQNKCIHYEAPFLFLFIGNKKALLMDTGATSDEKSFPLFETVKKIVEQWEQLHGKVDLIVAHTHAHRDHIAADNQFKGKPNTEVLGLDVRDITSFFKIDSWPSDVGKIDLGNRIMDVIPIPGHEKSSIALYDRETKILLSGDSFYPGRLYVQDWKSYRSSIQRITDFANKHGVSYILGNHIEMTKTPGLDYKTGTTYQPDEQNLPLERKDLRLLNDTLQKSGEDPKRIVLDKFIIAPVNH